MNLDYTLVLVGGVAISIALPKRWASVRAAILLGAALVACTALRALNAPNAVSTVVDLALLRHSNSLADSGLGVVVSAYTLVLAGLLSAIRLLVSRKESLPPAWLADAEPKTEAVTRTRALGRGLVWAGSFFFLVWALTPVAQRLDVFPGMRWGQPNSPGHYLDLISLTVALGLVLTGAMLRRT